LAEPTALVPGTIDPPGTGGSAGQAQTPPGGTAPDLRRGGVGLRGDPPWGPATPGPASGRGSGWVLLLNAKEKAPKPGLGARGDEGATTGSAAMVPHAAAGPPPGGVSDPQGSRGMR